MTTGTELVPADIDARAAEIERQVEQARTQAKAMRVRDQAEYDLACALTRKIQARRKAIKDEHKQLKAPILEAGRRIDKLKNDWLAPLDAADEVLRPKLKTYTDEQDRIRREKEERLERERLERERKAREAREAQEAEERAKREQAEREQREAEEEARKAKDAADRETAERLAEEARIAAEEASTAEAAIASLPEVQLPQAVVRQAPKPEGIVRQYHWRVSSIDASKLPAEYLIPDEKAINAAMREGVKESGEPPAIPGVEWVREARDVVRS